VKSEHPGNLSNRRCGIFIYIAWHQNIASKAKI